MFILALVVIVSGIAILASPWFQGENDDIHSILVGGLLTIQITSTIILSAATIWKEFN